MVESLFYKNLKSFLKELVVVFPEDDDELQIITTSINLAIIDNDNKLLYNYYNSLNPLENEIIKRNEDIFKKDPSKYWAISSYEYKLFVKLNNSWNTFSEHNKTIIWDYIHVLYILSKQITLK
jgi:hypothetical protein